MRHERVKVTRDNNTVHSLTVPSWEIPMLQFLFDEGNVTRTGEFIAVNREYPDPAMEFARLQKAYGSNVKTDVPHAVSVYGVQHTGVRELRKAIEAARKDEAEAMPKPARRRRAAVLDPLLA